MQTSTARLAARVKPDTYALIRRAAEIEGITLTDFIITNLQSAARKVIAESEVIQLSVRDQKAFAKALTEDYQPNEKLTQAIEDYQKLFGKSS